MPRAAKPPPNLPVDLRPAVGDDQIRIGRYTVEKLLARGGMAEVFLARAEGPAGFSKQVVIKRILPEFVQDARFVQMFLDEARLAAQLNHPNIVQVFDFGQDRGSYFIAMEYIEGESLRNFLAYARQHGDGTVEPTIVAQMLAGACEGLHYAHSLCDPNGASLNIIHRDVSPDNILVSTSGITKVVDFGIAKAQGNSNRTQAGTLKGKYSYMSPELIRGQAVDRRLDIYALGVTLYEVLSGRRPFSADNEMTLLHSILSDAPTPLSEISASVPPMLSAVAARAMDKEPERRFPDARAMGAALNEFLIQFRPRMSAVEVAELVKVVRSARKPVLDLHSSGPKAVPGFPPEGVNALGNRVTRLLEGRHDEATSVVPDAAIEELSTPPPPPRPRWRLPAMAAAGVAAAAAVGFFVLRPDAPSAPPPAAPLAAPTPTPTPAPAAPPAPSLPPPPPPLAVAPEPLPAPDKVAPDPKPAALPRVAAAVRPKPAAAIRTAAPAAKAPRGLGKLDVNCNPWCHIYIDGADSGRDSPAVGIELSAGPHHLKVVNPPTSVEQERDVVIEADQTAKTVVRF